MWQLDADSDGYPANTTIATSTASPGAGYRRYANMVSANTDCNDGNAGITYPCYAYAQDQYYAYGQGNYYGYGENTYYGQANYYAYGQGNYYGYGYSEDQYYAYGESGYYGEGYYYHENFYYEPPAP
jgi:hypothetical protein